MKTTAAPESWTIPEALAVAYTAFTRRFGAELLPKAFEALTLRPAETMQTHRALNRNMGNYISSAMDARGAGLVEWMASARADRDQDAMLLDIAVRWWLARDALARQARGTRVPCTYVPGLTSHSGHQLLLQMLHRGNAPDTSPSAGGPAQTSRA